MNNDLDLGLEKYSLPVAIDVDAITGLHYSVSSLSAFIKTYEEVLRFFFVFRGCGICHLCESSIGNGSSAFFESWTVIESSIQKVEIKLTELVMKQLWDIKHFSFNLNVDAIDFIAANDGELGSLSNGSTKKKNLSSLTMFIHRKMVKNIPESPLIRKERTCRLHFSFWYHYDFTSCFTDTNEKIKSFLSEYQNPCCQVEGYNLDLKSAKDYHRCHRICKIHSKCPRVILAGKECLFCQQCNRFLDMSEFDDKRSWRCLSDHNTR